MAFIPFIIPPQTCQSCRAVLTLGTRRCPSCGTEVARLSVLPLWAVIGLGLLTLGLVAFLAFGETMPSPHSSPDLIADPNCVCATTLSSR